MKFKKQESSPVSSKIFKGLFKKKKKKASIMFHMEWLLNDQTADEFKKQSKGIQRYKREIKSLFIISAVSTKLVYKLSRQSCHTHRWQLRFFNNPKRPWRSQGCTPSLNNDGPQLLQTFTLNIKNSAQWLSLLITELPRFVTHRWSFLFMQALFPQLYFL